MLLFECLLLQPKSPHDNNKKWWVVFFPSFLPKENHDGNCLEASNMAHNGVLAVPVRFPPLASRKKGQEVVFQNRGPPEN